MNRIKIKCARGVCDLKRGFQTMLWNFRADLGGGCRGCTPPPPEMKPSSSYSFLKFVYLTGQWRHSLEVRPLLNLQVHSIEFTSMPQVSITCFENSFVNDNTLNVENPSKWNSDLSHAWKSIFMDDFLLKVLISMNIIQRFETVLQKKNFLFLNLLIISCFGSYNIRVITQEFPIQCDPI